MKSFKVQLAPLGIQLQVKEHTPLLDVLHEFGIEFPCGGKGSCGRCRVKILQGEIEVNSLHGEMLERLELDSSWRLACMSACTSDLVLEVGQFETIIQLDDTPFEFKPSKGLGIAFDLGTTTMVAQLLDLETGRILAVESGLNPQKKFGSDLVSRLEAALGGKAAELTRMVRSSAEEMIVRLMEGYGRRINVVVFVGNTVMHHLFSGLEIKALSFYPFESEHLEAQRFSSMELGWTALDCPRIDFYPAIAGFVGSDILAGILATGMHRKEGINLLVDLGTNGEIVAGNKSRLVCASTAAGPAFEGARISQGMQARSGAIASLRSREEGGWTCDVIGKVPSRGICGSGLIDAITILVEQGYVGGFGEILSGEESVMLDKNVALTQRDIQEFQLAKAAIAAGIDILLRELGASHSDVENIYISGGFGNYINLKHVADIGMLDFPEHRIHKLGNSALLGAKMFLFKPYSDPMDILNLCSHLNLESVQDFQDVFVEKLSF